MKTVLLFGTFDGLHPGHEAMLRDAWRHGDKIVVALAPDEVVKRLKGRAPDKSFDERFNILDASGLVDEIVPSDNAEGAYAVLARVKPDVVAFGYDQVELKADFESFLKKSKKKIPTVTLAAFEPERYKSSLLNQ